MTKATDAEKKRLKRRLNLLKKIRESQRNSVELTFQKLPFLRQLRIIATNVDEKLFTPPPGKQQIGDISRKPLRFQRLATLAIQEASEAYLLGVFEDAFLCTLHAKRVTLNQKDIQLALTVRGDMDRMDYFGKRGRFFKNL